MNIYNKKYNYGCDAKLNLHTYRLSLIFYSEVSNKIKHMIDCYCRIQFLRKLIIVFETVLNEI